MILREDDNAAIISDTTIRSAIERAAYKVGADPETRAIAARYLSDALVELALDNLERLAVRAVEDAKVIE
jgi:hypothetical protein